MSRIALIGENSIEYIEKIIEIWNSGNCAVLIDWKIPIETAYKMMLQAKISKCFIDKRIYNKIKKEDYKELDFEEYSSNINKAIKVPFDIYKKFKNNYSTDDAIVIYSSGTTGKAKGIILSHYAININAEAIQNYMQLTSDDCLYIAKPFSHSSTLTGELLIALKYNSGLVIAPTIVPPRIILTNISKFKITKICLNPSLLKMCAEEYRHGKYDLTFLKTIYVSGSVLCDEIYELAHSTFKDIPIYNVYGLSEAGPRVAAQTVDCCRNNSVGKPLKNIEIALIDESGRCVPPGKQGIIHVNTPSRFKGYITGVKKYNSLHKNWLNTGDIGFYDKDNELHIIGRTDDVIFLDSHKIYRYEIEKTIKKYTGISACAVVPLKINGNCFIGCMYISDCELCDIRKILLRRLPVFEVRRVFLKCNSLPMTANEKISRRRVQDILLEYLSKDTN